MDSISQVIHDCETCAMIKQAKRLKPLWYGGRWSRYKYGEAWQIDYITLPQTRQGKHYVLTMDKDRDVAWEPPRALIPSFSPLPCTWSSHPLSPPSPDTFPGVRRVSGAARGCPAALPGAGPAGDGELEPPPASRIPFPCPSQAGASSGCRARSAAAFGTLSDSRRVKQVFSSKMSLQVLVLCLTYSGLGKANVLPQEHKKVRMGDSATLSCALTKPMDVVQVTWQKDSEDFHDNTHDNIATYSTSNGLKIHKPYEDRMNFTSLELNKTSITFWVTRMEDSGCYKCVFNAFPLGPFSATTCLSVFGLNASVHHNISEGHLIAICNADGFPEPTITWNNLFDSTPTQKIVKHKNGIVSITSKLEIYNIQSIKAQDLTCRVNNTDETFELPVKIGEGRKGIIIALAGDYCGVSCSHHSSDSDYTVLEEDPVQEELKWILEDFCPSNSSLEVSSLKSALHIVT
ncbi:PREDICTED: uncharacterized protein LOC102105245 [Pseudopodoces humilis]|uniref:uncharacterized protein LOC102105245 n=1 Tax=Pseudopodoces humilis TaxID=181119 RepID=UPI0006B78870|nr:PREDICTED: uncharacterized protein LOC102105245 [Pseudopodoces humilis]